MEKKLTAEDIKTSVKEITGDVKTSMPLVYVAR